MVFPVGGAPDGNNPIDWSNAKDFYNRAQGNREEFIKFWFGSTDSKEKVANSDEVSAIFGFLKSMDTDGKAGLSDEEYIVGLTEKKEALEIKINNDWQQFSNYMDLEEFNKLTKEQPLDNLIEWYLDLGLATSYDDAKDKASTWLTEWQTDNEKLDAIQAKLDEMNPTQTAKNQGEVGGQDGGEPTPPVVGGFKRIAIHKQKFEELREATLEPLKEVSEDLKEIEKLRTKVKMNMEAEMKQVKKQYDNAIAETFWDQGFLSD